MMHKWFKLKVNRNDYLRISQLQNKI